MLKRSLLAALLCFAGPVSAAVVNGPQALRVLQRYDLPGGGNLPTLLLDAVHRQLGLPPSVQIPVALRFFGSSVYLADETRNTVDWKRVHDLDIVLYVDRDEHRVALEGAHPFRTARWIASKQDSALSGLEKAVGKSLWDIAGQLGAFKKPHVILAEEDFDTLASLGHTPMRGYHAYEPHFGTEPGIAKILSVVEKLPVRSLYQAIELRDMALQRDLEDRLAAKTLDSKILKRVIQRARLLGDDATGDKYARLLKAYPTVKFDGSDLEILEHAVDQGIASSTSKKKSTLMSLKDLLRRGRVSGDDETLVKWSRLLKVFPEDWFAAPDLELLERLVAQTLAAWQKADFDRFGRLQRTAEKAALAGGDLVVVPR